MRLRYHGNLVFRAFRRAYCFFEETGIVVSNCDEARLLKLAHQTRVL